MKRWTLLLAAGLTGLAVAGVGFTIWLIAPQPRINQAAYEEIQVGMHESEIEALLGGPSGDYRTGPVEYEPQLVGFIPTHRRVGRGPIVRNVWPKLSEWHGNEGRVEVAFDQDGRAAAMCFQPGQATGFDLRFLVRRWLRL